MSHYSRVATARLKTPRPYLRGITRLYWIKFMKEALLVSDKNLYNEMENFVSWYFSKEKDIGEEG